MQPRSLLPFLLLALGVSAIPAHIKREDVPNYVNSDGSIDFSALTADAAIVPTIVAPAQASNVILPIDTEAISEDVVNQAADQADSTPAKRGLLTKRATAPTWAGYATCGPQSVFSQAKTVNNPDTPDAFRADATLAQKAKTAAKPSGYTLEYVALNGVYQSSTSNSFLGQTVLTSAQGYSPQYCANYCDTKVKGCLGFNIYYERDPSIALPGTTDIARCNNPPSATSMVCQFFGTPVNAAAATSIRQVRGTYFRTAKAGSNGYSKATFVPPTISGFNAPLTFGGKVDNQKAIGKIAGTHLLTVNPNFDPQYCADVANKFYAGKYSSFETSMLKKNGAYVGQMCIVLTQGGFTAADANDAGQFGGKSSTFDETTVWYSSQPVYYYELPPAPAPEEEPVRVPATETPPPAPQEEPIPANILTFDEEISESYIVETNAPNNMFVSRFSGFRMGRSRTPSERDYGIIRLQIPEGFLEKKTGNYAYCYGDGDCSLFTSPGTTFDVKKIDLSDLFYEPGTFTITGYKGSNQVATTTVSNAGGWQTYSLPDSFSRLDQLKVEGSNGIQVPAFDNVHYFKHITIS